MASATWTREHEVALAEIKKTSRNEVEIKSVLGDIKVELFQLLCIKSCIQLIY